MNINTKVLFLIILIILVGILISLYIRREGYYSIYRPPPGMDIKIKGEPNEKEGFDISYGDDGFPEPPVAAVPPTVILPPLEMPHPGRTSKTDLILSAEDAPDDGTGPAPVANASMGYYRNQRILNNLEKSMITGF